MVKVIKTNEWSSQLGTHYQCRPDDVNADEPMDHTQFYFVANCRFIWIQPHEDNGQGRIWETEPRRETMLHKYSLETLKRRPDLLAYLERFPIWEIETAPHYHLASDALIADGQALKLNGFQASDSKVTRHVHDIHSRLF